MKLSNAFLVLSFLIFSCSQRPQADVVVIGKIWTGNANQPYAEAMAIAGDSIVAVGSVSDMEKWIGDKTERIEATEGQLIAPGFIDAHTHFIDGGFGLSSVFLRDAKTPDEFIRRIRDFAKTVPQGTWITGGDWDQQNWGGKMPERTWIDSVTKNNPVWISRLDGHMALANTAAIKAAGIDDKVKDVDGGVIVRDKKGKLVGLFKDNAQYLIGQAQPAPSNEREDQALQAAMHYVASNGVTSVHSVYGGWAPMERARAQNKLFTRIYAGTMLSNWRMLDEKIKKEGRGDAWLQFGALKEFVDGSIGSHTAAFFKPFADSPKDSGFFLNSPEVLYRGIKSADSAGLHLIVHAIGDRGINTLLNIFERVQNENGPRDRRFKMEHVQHLHPNDIPRFKKLGVIASMQPYHAIDDGRYAEQTIGYERCKTTYAFRSLIDAGAMLAFGSDWSVAPATPLEGIYAAVTRRTLDDKNPDGWVPEQKISVEEAMTAYTINAAYASFEERIKGSLETGKKADYVILEKDITTINPVEIRNVKVMRTVVGGNTVYLLN